MLKLFTKITIELSEDFDETAFIDACRENPELLNLRDYIKDKQDDFLAGLIARLDNSFTGDLWEMEIETKLDNNTVYYDTRTN